MPSVLVVSGSRPLPPAITQADRQACVDETCSTRELLEMAFACLPTLGLHLFIYQRPPAADPDALTYRGPWSPTKPAP